MNREMLQKVRDRIAEVAPEHCDMGSFTDGVMLGQGEPHCGTSACIAGFAIAVKQGQYIDDNDNPERLGAEALEISVGDADNLFYAVRWPHEFQTIYYRGTHQNAMLAVLDALLDGSLTLEYGVWGGERSHGADGEDN